MATIAFCAHCSAESFFIDHPTAERRACCPECGSEFCVGQVSMRSLPEAQLLPEADFSDSILPEPRILPEAKVLLDSSRPNESNSLTLAEIAPLESSWHQATDVADGASDSHGNSVAAPKEKEFSADLSIDDRSNRVDMEVDSLQLSASATPSVSPEMLDITARSIPSSVSDFPDGASLEVSDKINDIGELEIEESEIEEPLPEEPLLVEPLLADTASLVRSSTWPHQRRKGIPALATALGLGVVVGGTLLGQYALLWLRGSNADYLQMAQYLPEAALPAAMRESAMEEQSSGFDAVEQIASADNRPAPEESYDKENHFEENDSGISPKNSYSEVIDSVTRDPFVQPATATAEPTHQPAKVVAPSLDAPSLDAQLLDAPQYEAEEFLLVFAAAQESQPRLLDGDLSTRESVVRKGQSFIAMCRLAEKFAFVERGSASIATKILQTKDLFRQTMADSKTRSELAQIATRWLAHPQRSTAGIFFAGRIVDVKTKGPWYEYTLVLESEGASHEVRVVMDRLRYTIDQQIGIVGTLVTRPEQRLAGYLAQTDQTKTQRHGPKEEPTSAIVLANFSFDLNKPDTQASRNNLPQSGSVLSKLGP